jgi:histidine ammonia-lyase
VTACELLAAYQGCTLAGRRGAPGAADLLDGLATLIPPVLADRPFGEDIERISQALAGPGIR